MNNCCHKTKERTPDQYKSLINRLNRIEGQIRGIRKMVEQDAYCTDVLMQTSAVNAAIGAFNRELLAQHIRTCVVEYVKKGEMQTVDELVQTVERLMK